MTTGVENLNTEDLSIYPNPANETITIEPKQNTGEFTLAIYYMNGQELIKQKTKDSQIQIDISGLPSGVYFVKLINDKNVLVRKFIKK